MIMVTGIQWLAHDELRHEDVVFFSQSSLVNGCKLGLQLLI